MAAQNLLQLLEPAVITLLKPHMRTASLEHGDVLHNSTSDMEFAYFPMSTGAPSGGKPRRPVATSMQAAARQQRYQADPGIFRTDAWHAADHHQHGRAHASERRPYPDRESRILVLDPEASAVTRNCSALWNSNYGSASVSS